MLLSLLYIVYLIIFLYSLIVQDSLAPFRLKFHVDGSFDLAILQFFRSIIEIAKNWLVIILHRFAGGGKTFRIILQLFNYPRDLTVQQIIYFRVSHIYIYICGIIFKHCRRSFSNFSDFLKVLFFGRSTMT